MLTLLTFHRRNDARNIDFYAVVNSFEQFRKALYDCTVAMIGDSELPLNDPLYVSAFALSYHRHGALLPEFGRAWDLICASDVLHPGSTTDVERLWRGVVDRWRNGASDLDILSDPHLSAYFSPDEGYSGEGMNAWVDGQMTRGPHWAADAAHLLRPGRFDVVDDQAESDDPFSDFGEQ